MYRRDLLEQRARMQPFVTPVAGCTPASHEDVLEHRALCSRRVILKDEPDLAIAKIGRGRAPEA